jgi:CBS domain-containing protein
MKVADVLKEKGGRIVTVRLNETVEMAVRLMSRESIGALAVKDVVRTEGNTCVGMVSERDVVHALAEHGTAAMQMSVERMMSKRLISCSPEEELGSVIEKMDTHGIRHLPVLENHTLIGVISVRDVLRVLRSQQLPGNAASAA